MSKAVLISIRPEWCEKIVRGEKTIEARKTVPKLKPPFKCYIYETKGAQKHYSQPLPIAYNEGCGKVIGEFVCDGIYAVLAHPAVFAGHATFFTKAIEDACLTQNEVEQYAGGKDVYGWHISDLVIYDEPQPLNWFVTEGDCDCSNCRSCSWFNRGNGYNVEDDCDLGYESIYRKKPLKPLFRPPQSWCYVEELQKEEADG